MLDFDPTELPLQRELDDAHERGFRRFLSIIGHKSQIQSHRDLASKALIDLRTRLNEDSGPNYEDPYIAAAYLVRYHLSHCALAYWSFESLFCSVDIPKSLYLCDVGAGTHASRVGLELALVKHIGDYRKFPEVYFDAIEPSEAMAMAGECFWEAFSEVCNLNLHSSFRTHRDCPFTMEKVPGEAMRVVSAFHLSLPYNADWITHPLAYRYGKSRSLSPAHQGLQSALNLVKPNAGIFTCHTNKGNSLREAVDGFPGWESKATNISIPKDEGILSRSSFYTTCAESYGFTVPESEPWPVRTWSKYRFSLPDGLLLLRIAPSNEELRRLERERAAKEKQQWERERQRKIEQGKRERERQKETERLAAQRAEAARLRQEEERKRQEALDRLWATLESCRESSEVISAEVLGTNSGGLMVKWEGLRGFVPFSHCRDIASRDDFDALARLTGQSFDFNVLDTDRAKNDFKLTRATIIERGTWDTLKRDQVIDGVVVRTTSFGAFVRVAESIEGLVHISQLSTEWVSAVEKVVTQGQAVKVRVLDVDAENTRLSLSIKDALPNPWDSIDSFLRIGDKRTGKVQRIEDNKRLVVDIGDSLQGRIHISQLGNWEIGSFHPGDELLVEVLRIDLANRLIWLRAAEQWSV